MKWNKALLLLVMLPILASCSNGTGSCNSFKAIRLAPGEAEKLSPESRKEILDHDKTGAKICSWKA